MAGQGDASEIGKNCSACKKALSKSKRYYRNGSYYCNKNCYKKKVAAMAEQEGSE